MLGRSVRPRPGSGPGAKMSPLLGFVNNCCLMVATAGSVTILGLHCVVGDLFKSIMPWSGFPFPRTAEVYNCLFRDVSLIKEVGEVQCAVELLGNLDPLGISLVCSPNPLYV